MNLLTKNIDTIIVGVIIGLVIALNKYIWTAISKWVSPNICKIADFFRAYSARIVGATSEKKFVVLIATLDGDLNGAATNAIQWAFQGHQGLERRRTCRVIKLGPARSDEFYAQKRAQALLKRHDADLLVWGAVQKDAEVLRLWFSTRDAASDFRRAPFRLEANQLGEDFKAAANLQIVAVALSSISFIGSGKFIQGMLSVAVERIDAFLNGEPGLNNRQTAELQDAAGLACAALANYQSRAEQIHRAIGYYSKALAHVSRDQDVALWGKIQRHVGAAYASLADFQINFDYLNYAQGALQSSLDARRDGDFLEALRTRQSLFAVQSAIAFRSQDAQALNAVAGKLQGTFDAKVREASPILWAHGRAALGLTLVRLGKVRADIDPYCEAEGVLLDAETVIGSDAPSLKYSILNTRANLYVGRDELHPSNGDLHFAVELWGRALRIVSPDSSIAHWAAAQINLASVLQRLGQREQNQEYILEAIQSLRDALRQLPDDAAEKYTVPLKANLGEALLKLDELAVGPGIIGDLRFIASPHFIAGGSINWDANYVELSPMVERLQRADDSIPNIEEAIVNLTSALQSFRRQDSDFDWGVIQTSLGNAQRRLGERTRDPVVLDAAEETFRAYLSERDREVRKADWAGAHFNLGAVKMSRGVLTGNIQEFREAEGLFRLGLVARRELDNKVATAEMAFMLAAAIFMKANGVNSSDLEEAEMLLSEAESTLVGSGSVGSLKSVENLKRFIAALRMVD